MNQKIIIAGGTGFLGQAIIQFFSQKKDISLVILTRQPSRKEGKIKYVHWDAATTGYWTKELEECTAIINLVGKSVNCRYTSRNKRAIIESRVNATLVIGRAIRQAVAPPKVWINAGSAAIFGDGGSEVKTEQSQTGEGFSAEVCKQWEKAFFDSDAPQTRKVFLRIGLVFQKNRGLLVPFTNLVNAGFGGTIGSGKQYISWIHETDFLKLVNAILVNEKYKGIVHCTSPNPVTNRHFMSALRGGLQKSFGFPNPSILVKAGAFFIGTEAMLVLTGRRVISTRLQAENFMFEYPFIENALEHLLEKRTN